MRAWSLEQRAADKTLGFVPTMGALHEGHASLMRASVRDSDISVLSIFVNPAQFAPHEDFDQYPRTWESDLAMAEACGVEVIYAPTSSAMYPEGYSTFVTVEGVQEGLCSLTRPHFFRGVATVCMKLFNAVYPHKAYFGQKDAQQCAVIKRMVRDMDLPLSIVECPIVREAVGLAMSSRNKYLSASDRNRALCLSRALSCTEDALHNGERDVAVLEQIVRENMSEVPVDYIAIVCPDTIQPIQGRIDGAVLIAVAANLGPARLIDNIKFDPAKKDAYPRIEVKSIPEERCAAC
jgi:pantoate--beta-alanine ligase